MTGLDHLAHHDEELERRMGALEEIRQRLPLGDADLGANGVLFRRALEAAKLADEVAHARADGLAVDGERNLGRH